MSIRCTTTDSGRKTAKTARATTLAGARRHDRSVPRAAVTRGSALLRSGIAAARFLRRMSNAKARRTGMARRGKKSTPLYIIRTHATAFFLPSAAHSLL